MFRYLLPLFFIIPLLAQPFPARGAATPPVAILVDGFGDCCTNQMGFMISGLKNLGVQFPAVAMRNLSGNANSDYTVPWNSMSGMDQGFSVNMNLMSYLKKPDDILSGAMSVMNAVNNPQQALLDNAPMIMEKVRKGTDKKFQEEVAAYLNSLPADQPVILIGHSFGADSITKVISNTDKSIMLVAVLDPVGAGGVRKLVKNREIPGHVKYFYNRWQETKPFPFDLGSSGVFNNCHAQTCDQKDRSDGSQGRADHETLPSQEDVQDEIVAIAASLLKGATPVAPPKSEAAPAPDKKEAVKDMLKKLPGLSW